MAGTEERACITLINDTTGKVSADSGKSPQFPISSVYQDARRSPEFKDFRSVWSEFTHPRCYDFLYDSLGLLGRKDEADNWIEKGNECSNDTST